MYPQYLSRQQYSEHSQQKLMERPYRPVNIVQGNPGSPRCHGSEECETESSTKRTSTPVESCESSRNLPDAVRTSYPNYVHSPNAFPRAGCGSAKLYNNRQKKSDPEYLF